MKTLTNSRICYVSLIVMVLMLGAAVSAAAKGPVKGGGDEEYRQVMATSVDTVTIAKKTLKRVITNIGESFALSGETLIVDTNGRQLSIRKLPVPCEAVVTYTQNKGARQAIRIQLKSVSSDATKNWTAKHPE